jgi:hypothetical protein
MELTKLTCPECGKVIKPAKPVAEGKKIRCPKCDNVFVAGEDEPDEDEAPAKKPKKKDADGAIKKSKAAPPEKASKKDAGKKPAEKKAPEKPPEKKSALDDEDDGPMTYNFTKEDKEDDDKPDIDYAPDTSIKDPRGPAQAIVMQPTNYMLMSGIFGFIGYVILLCIILIPVLFPISNDDTTDKNNPKPILNIGQGLAAAALAEEPPDDPRAKDKEKEEADKRLLLVAGVDLALMGLYQWYLFLFLLSPIFLGMAWCALVAYAAVKVQSLESRVWGIVGSIMTMIPYCVGGLLIVLCVLVGILGGMLFDDRAYVAYMQIGILAILVIGELATGIWVLVTLMKEEVIEGFDFVPEG